MISVVDLPKTAWVGAKTKLLPHSFTRNLQLAQGAVKTFHTFDTKLMPEILISGVAGELESWGISPHHLSLWAVGHFESSTPPTTRRACMLQRRCDGSVRQLLKGELDLRRDGRDTWWSQVIFQGLMAILLQNSVLGLVHNDFMLRNLLVSLTHPGDGEDGMPRFAFRYRLQRGSPFGHYGLAAGRSIFDEEEKRRSGGDAEFNFFEVNCISPFLVSVCDFSLSTLRLEGGHRQDPFTLDDWVGWPHHRPTQDSTELFPPPAHPLAQWGVADHASIPQHALRRHSHLKETLLHTDAASAVNLIRSQRRRRTDGRVKSLASFSKVKPYARDLLSFLLDLQRLSNSTHSEQQLSPSSDIKLWIEATLQRVIDKNDGTSIGFAHPLELHQFIVEELVIPALRPESIFNLSRGFSLVERTGPSSQSSSLMPCEVICMFPFHPHRRGVLKAIINAVPRLPENASICFWDMMDAVLNEWQSEVEYQCGVQGFKLSGAAHHHP